jgi:multisubunit Na+/H+ antiporter MnhE subunit
MGENAHNIVTWLLVIALVMVITYSLSLFYWTLGVIFALICLILILVRFPPNEK